MEAMLPKYQRAYDMDSWLRDSRIAERGYIHRWQSAIAPDNGEDAFIELIEQHLHTNCDVLDLGCGHGEFTLSLAARCRTITGVERNPEYLALAQELTAEQKVNNVRFLQADLAGPDEQTRPFVGIPLPDASIDLFINRRGPGLRRYLAEAIRLARPGAIIIGLHPAGNAPAPVWQSRLPKPLQDVFMAVPYEEVASWVTEPLRASNIFNYSLWWIDVPEFLRDPHELYIRLSAKADNIPPYPAIEEQLARIFTQYATPKGISLRHQRLLWQAFLT